MKPTQEDLERAKRLVSVWSHDMPLGLLTSKKMMGDVADLIADERERTLRSDICKAFDQSTAIFLENHKRVCERDGCTEMGIDFMKMAQEQYRRALGEG